MDAFDVNVESRIVGGKGEIRRLKNEGMIPGVLYNGKESIPIALDSRWIQEILDKNGDDVVLNISFEGRRMEARVQEVQRDPVSKEIRHIDIMPLDNNESRHILH